MVLLSSVGGGVAVTTTLAQSVYVSCCRKHHVKPNAQILGQLRAVAAPQIVSLDASTTFLGAAGVHALLDFVEAHQTISTLELQKNGVDADGVLHLCRLLENHRSLKSVSLANNHLSIPSTRALWDAAKRCKRLEHLDLTGCHLPEEWEHRIEKSLANNGIYQREGFVHPSAFRLRSAEDWVTSFVALVGPPELTSIICDQVLHPMNSVAAASHVRIAPIVIQPDDLPEVVEWKIQLTCDANHYGLPRIVMAVDADSFDAPSVVAALQHVAAAVHTPAIPPLRNKLGQPRDPVPRLSVFQMTYCAAVGSDLSLASSDTAIQLGAADLEQRAYTHGKKQRASIADDPSDGSGVQRRRAYELFQKQLVAECVAASGEDVDSTGRTVFAFDDLQALILRAQTDLCVSFSTTLAANGGLRRSSSIAVDGVSDGRGGVLNSGSELDGVQREVGNRLTGVAMELLPFRRRVVEMLVGLRELGELHQDDLEEVLRYIRTPTMSNSYPLVLYGGEGIGKRHVAAAAALRYLSAERCESGDCHASPADPLCPDVPHRVYPLILGHNTTESPVLICYFLLSIFAPSRLQEYFSTVDVLAEAARLSVERYRGDDRVTLFLIGIDQCDRVGSRKFNTLSCLAASLPPNVRVVVTVATESPLLVHFRTMTPQPYERLLRRLPLGVLLGITRSKYASVPLHNGGPIVIPGLTEEYTTDAAITMAVASPLPSPVKLILEKEDVESHVFCELLGLHLRHNAGRLDSVERVIQFVSNEVGSTVPQLFQGILATYQARYGEASVRIPLLALAVSPLPMTELVMVCEQLAGCPRHTVLPVTLQLINDGILASFRDGIIAVAHGAIRSAIREQYGGAAIPQLSVVVASHFHRLIMTSSPETSFALQRCTPLLLDNMQHDLVESVVLDPVIVDQVLASDIRNVLFLTDALYRFMHAVQLFREILVTHTLQLQPFTQLRTLRLALHHVQTSDSHRCFFQSALLSDRDGPYRRQALRVARVAPPYPVLVPRNDIGQESTSEWSLDVSPPPRDESASSSDGMQGRAVHCHIVGDLVVATTPSRVVVARASTGKLLAQLDDPFGPSVVLLASFVAIENKIVVVAADQLLLWDLGVNTWTLIPDVTTSLSGNAFDVARTMLLCVVPSTMALVMVDLNKKRATAHSISYSGGPIREAILVGMHNTIVVMSVYDVTLVSLDETDGAQHVVLGHPGLVRCVSGSPDGKFLVTAVGTDVYLWTSKGDLMHLCSDHTAAVNDVVFHPNGSLFASCADDGTVKVWKTLTGLLSYDLRVDDLVDPGRVPVVPSFAAFSSDGTRLFARCGDFLRQWDATTFLSAGTVRACGGYITSMSLSATHVAAATSDGRLKLWSTKAAFPTAAQAVTKSISTLLLVESKVSQVAIRQLKLAPNAEFVVARDAENRVSLWHLRTGRPLSQLSGVDAFCALDGTTLFTVERDRISVFTVGETNERVASHLLPRDTPVNPTSLDLHFSRDRQELFVLVNAGVSTRIYVYELPSFRLTNVFQGHVGTIVFCAKLSSDLVVTAGDDGGVILWSLSGHAERASYRHPTRIVSALVVGDGTSCERPILFIDDRGEIFDVMVSSHDVVGKAKVEAKKKRIHRGDGVAAEATSSPSLHTSAAASPPASTPAVDAPPKLTTAARLTSELLLVTNELGAAFILHEQEAKVTSAVLHARCSCTPQVLGSLVMIGTSDGGVDMYDLALPLPGVVGRNSLTPHAAAPSVAA